MRRKKVLYIAVGFLILTVLELVFANNSAKRIHEEEADLVTEEEIEAISTHLVTEEEIEALSTHDVIEKTNDLSISDNPIASIDINHQGELLVCFTDKIIVFNESFEAVRAYKIDWGKGQVPFAVWNQESGNIIYMRGDGYEFNTEGIIFCGYDVANKMEYKKSKVKWDGKTYELQSRVFLPNITSKESRTYSTLVAIDEQGQEKVLCNSQKKQFITLGVDYMLWTGCLILVIRFVIKMHKEAKLQEMRYGK